MCTTRGHARSGVIRSGLLLAGALHLLTPTTCPAAGEPLLRAVRFSGNSTLSDSRLRSAIQAAGGTPLSDSVLVAAVRSVRRLYAEEGFFSVTILPSLARDRRDSATADLVLEISEGEAALIRQVVFRGNTVLSAATLAELLQTGPGDVPSVGAIEEGISAILAAYDRAGHPYTKVTVADVTPVDGSVAAVDITVDLDEGRPVTISRFRVRGNTETNDDVILRESRMELPARYDPGRIARFAERLRRLGLFSRVQDPELFRTGEGEGLLVSVTEGGNNSFDGILGYLPPSAGSGEGRVTGLVNVSMRNLFGTGRKLEAEWSRDGGSSQQIRLGYTEPWVFGFPVNLSGTFFQKQQDSTYVERSLDLGAEFLLSGSFTVSAVAGQKRVIPSDRPGLTGIRNATTTTAGIAVRYDTRDERATPRSGIDYHTEYRAGSKNAAGADPAVSRSVSSLGLDIDVYLPVRRGQVLDLGLHGRRISIDDVEQGDLFYLGGVRTLRGFRENRFSGTRVAWGTVEYRLLTGGETFFFAFFDPGYVYSPLTGPPELFTFGYGIGVRLETGLGLVGVSFALGKGDPVSETKIHFGLINGF